MADILDIQTGDDDLDMGGGGDGGDGGIQRVKEKVKRRKGRGFQAEETEAQQELEYEGIEEDDAVPLPSAGADGATPQRSVEGWILFVTGVHEEAQEDDVMDKFSEFGQVMNLHLNLDRRTGYLKGYALVEYAGYKEALKALESLDGTELLGQKIRVNWGFVRPVAQTHGRSNRRRERVGGRRR